MASLSFTIATFSTSSSPFLSQKAPQLQRRLKTNVKQAHRFQVSCNVSSNDHEKTPLPTNHQPQKLILPETTRSLDRRNVLLGLGGAGLYSTVNLPSAFANPIHSPSILTIPSCKDAGSGFNAKDQPRSSACCPPASRNGPETDYELPKLRDDITRVRKPVQNPDMDVVHYRNAIEKMRALPDDDPRSFKNQAKIHCAYCNGSYMQNGQELQIHNSWLFFPFHRWYLFFFERILGDLIEKPDFALPYWNWDSLHGMVIPSSFENIYSFESAKNSPPNNALFDLYRDPKHLNWAKVDLDYLGNDRKGVDDSQLREINQTTMNRQMIRNAFDTTSFFGGKYVAGNKPIENADNVVGAIEAGCHTAIHRWVGHPRTPETPNGEDMGNFYSAGYDPLFYVHHANVDRMWTLWKQMGGQEPTDPDWENASYVFYDEKQNPVRVYNRDAVNLEKLGYQYAKSDDTSWTTKAPRSRCQNPAKHIEPNTTDEFIAKWKEQTTSLTLSETVRIRVPRPAGILNKNDEEMKGKKEILFIKGINFDGKGSVKFDVFVNACEDEEKYSPCDSENVGTFAALAHAKRMDMTGKSGMRLSLTEALKETKTDYLDYIRVTIVPQKETGHVVTIDEIVTELIDYVPLIPSKIATEEIKPASS